MVHVWQVFVIRDFRMQFAFLCRPLPGRAQVANPFGCIYECYTTIYVASPNPPKIDEKLSRIRVWRGPEGPWARSGSHGGPQGQGSPGALKCSKTTFEGHAGTPLWEAIGGTFFDFSVFLWHTFSEGGFGGLRGRCRVDFRMILEGNFEDFV